MVILDQVLTLAGFGVGYLLARGRRIEPPYMPTIAITRPPTTADPMGLGISSEQIRRNGPGAVAIIATAGVSLARFAHPDAARSTAKPTSDLTNRSCVTEDVKD
jgi:hypothetical protein